MNKYLIISCSDQNFWYANKVGDTILAKEVEWPSSYLEAKNGNSVLRSDLRRISPKKINKYDLEKIKYLLKHSLDKKKVINQYKELRGKSLKEVEGILLAHEAVKRNISIRRMKQINRMYCEHKNRVT